MRHAPPARARNRLSPDERIAKIMAVTREMLSEKGYEKIVTSEIADRCGISEATIYKYFASKRDLLVRVAEQWFEEILTIDQHITTTMGIHDRLRHLVRESLAVVRQEPTLTRFVLMELRSDPSYRSMHIYELNRKFTGKISALLNDAVKAGEFLDDVPVHLLRDMIFGCIEHQTWAFLRGEGDFSVDLAADSITNVIYRGMASTRPATKVRNRSPTSGVN